MRVFLRAGIIVLCMVIAIPFVSPNNGSRAHAEALPTVKMDFLTPDAEGTEGYLPDYGHEFGEQNGVNYGWTLDQSSNMVLITATDSPLESSFIRLQGEATWEMELPNGKYNIKVAVGDAEQDSLNTLFAEESELLAQLAVPVGESKVLTKTVQVDDGRLTIHTEDSTNITALQYLEITPYRETIRKPRAFIAPHIGLPAEENKVPSNHIILSGNQNNEHNAVPTIPVPGLGSEISRYMNENLENLMRQWEPYKEKAISCTGCSASDIASAIADNHDTPVAIRAGHLNLDSDVTFGSPTNPVFLTTDGINTNKALTLTIYGSLLVQGNFNANNGVKIRVIAPDNPSDSVGSNLRVSGTMHLNSDSELNVDGDLVAGSLIYNNGRLSIDVQRAIVENSMHINTKVDMSIKEEFIVGDLVSNNDEASIHVQSGDFFIQGDVHVNNHLEVQTGGVWAVGGNITANKRPIVNSGYSEEGKTKLKYTPYGLLAEYFSDRDLNGDRITVLDANIDLNGKFPVSSTGLTDGQYSVRWTGQIEPYATDDYVFTIQARGGVKLWIDGQPIIDDWNRTGENANEGTLTLESGHRYDIRMEYTGSSNQPRASLSWKSASLQQEVVPQRQLSPFMVPDLTALPSDEDITLAWTRAFNGEGYELEADGIIHPLDDRDQYVDSPLESGTLHAYRVRANGGGIHGEWSPISELWTLPGIPDNIRLESTSETIVLQWDEVRGAVTYEIEANNEIIDNGDSTTYTEQNLNPNMQRAFRVRAVNSSGPGKWSEVVAKTTLPGTTGSIRTEASESSIKVSWDAVSGAGWYELEVDGAAKKVEGTEYVHEHLKPGTTHSYRVRSGNADGYGEWSEPVQATVLPPVPKNLRAEASNDRITVEWDPVNEATGYELEVDGVVKDIGSELFYLHQGLPSNTDHSYRVRAKIGALTGEWTSLLTRTTLAAFPVNLQTESTGTEIKLTWDPVVGAVGYDVEADGQIYDSKLELLFIHSKLKPYTSHSYRVRARSNGGVGPWSETVNALTTLGKPENIKLASTKDSITISWEPVVGATAYELAVDGQIIDVRTKTQYTHDSLAPNSVHVYRVRAKNADLAGEWSEAFTKSTGLGAPVITQATAYSNRISLKWSEVEGATGYDVEVNGVVVDNGAAITYIHRNLASESKNTYRVRAKNSEGVSEWSAAVTRYTASESLRFVSATSTTSSISLTWTSVSSGEYDLEIDGTVISGLTTTSYTHKVLKPNTIHIYRVRSHSNGQGGEWSEPLEKKTVSEVIVNVGKDNLFNLVVIAPPKSGASERIVVVTFNPNEVEVMDLSAVTPAIELSAGDIPNAGMSIDRFSAGEIIIRVHNPNKTFVNGIRFLAKSNNSSSITYTVD
ncbi:hypothetical protein J19TS2_43500 [Cohnella xylanilytica]|uniref:PA14 domain-containing protein n=1 Tax=Cohnella xylanilytica TaxID=557555 RepID=A0A841U4F9_9BACL|nr:PA14 domain-containing protein [Cohnella xylanilytica]MBB6695486.1 hypothetical protein [Cohnella xylanilytica]GIO14795.1 hypothetical protein J19TS2_43500 [Cohnella xylanilytica]